MITAKEAAAKTAKAKKEFLIRAKQIIINEIEGEVNSSILARKSSTIVFINKSNDTSDEEIGVFLRELGYSYSITRLSNGDRELRIGWSE
jgi:hypothetical protein